MNLTVRFHSRLRAGAALVTASLAVILAGYSVSGPIGGSDPIVPAAQTAPTVSTSPRTATALQIVLRIDMGMATATLDDTPAGRQFGAMLPLQLELHDPMGQAKSGRLPQRLEVSGAERVVDPSVGEIYYWPPSGHIGIFYDDLGHSVPPPGMVRLGVVDGGLDAIASAGNRFILRMYPARQANS